VSWKEVSTLQLRTEFVSLARQEGANIKELCRRYNISRTTAYKWLKRFEEEGAAGLIDQSRRPLSSPGKTTAAPEKQILDLNLEHTGWGARKIKRHLEDKGHVMPAPSTVHAILKRNDRIDPAASLVKPFIRFEHPQPNDLWQMDFKGHVGLRAGRCHPLTLLDDHSRFSLAIAACANEKRETVQRHLISVFRRYGLPRRMTMDNGPPWGHEGDVYTGLELWMMRQGIEVCHSRPYHPQTQGKLERFHRSMKAELLTDRTLIDLDAAQQTFDQWRKIYNHQRPHQALNFNVPASRYWQSELCYQEVPAELEYGDDDEVRTVQANGELNWRGWELKLGRAFTGERVGLRRTLEDGKHDVYWGRHRVAQIDMNARSVISGKRLR